MMATIRFGEDDRDERGFIRLSPPASVETPIEPGLPAMPPPRTRPAAHAWPPLSPRLRYQLTMAGAAVAGLLLVLASMGRGVTHVPIASAPRPTAAPSASTQPSAAPTLPATAPAVAGRVLIAFAAPGGAVLGAIESTRQITPTAHYGEDWIQADVQGSGLVWLRTSDAPNLAIVGPDLAPPPTRTPVPPPPATATPEPPPCLTAGTGAQVVTVCGWGDLAAEARAKWLATYGGNAGIVITPSPADWSKP